MGWGLLGLGVDDVRVRLLPDVVAEQAEMFLINGDMQSNLYTSSRAMHSAILGLLQVSITMRNGRHTGSIASKDRAAYCSDG